MNLVDVISGPMAYAFVQRGTVAALMVGIVCAVMGTFVVLKGLAFIGDAVSHAAFPGLVIAFMVGVPLYLGASVAAVTTALGHRLGRPSQWAPIRHHRGGPVRRHVRVRGDAPLVHP